MPRRVTDWDAVATRLREAGPGVPVLVERQTPRCISIMNIVNQTLPVPLRDFPGGVRASMRNGKRIHYSDRVSDVYVTWTGEDG